MVFNVRCFKCGEQSVRLVLGGRSIIHAKCHDCESNLLAEVMELEQEVLSQQPADSSPEDTLSGVPSEPATTDSPSPSLPPMSSSAEEKPIQPSK